MEKETCVTTTERIEKARRKPEEPGRMKSKIKEQIRIMNKGRTGAEQGETGQQR
jgi:hypothetical protein